MGIRMRPAFIFPFLILIPLVVFTSLRISGTSEGIYHSIDSGGQRDPNLIAGHPRPIRSDEWLVSTQMVIAQAAAGYPVVNRNIGNGENMSVVLDVPYKDWSIVFKPQDLAFFVMPLENAFAFRWWLLLFLLALSAYLFVLELAPKKYLLASLFATFISLSPMVFWWYSSGIIAPLFYGLFLATLFIRVLKSDSLPKRLGFSSLFAYLLTCFALVMYPPFQIPVGLVVAVFCLGYLLQNVALGTITKQDAIRRVGVIAAATIVAASLTGLFLYTRADAISAVTHTIYPGRRSISSGGLNPLAAFSSFLSPEISRRPDGTFFGNQSEESNFILIAPFLLIPGLMLAAQDIKWRRQRPIDWPLHGINLLLIVFLARMFIPGGDGLYKLLLLNEVPHNRLLLGVGFLGFIQLVLLWRRLPDLFAWRWAGLLSIVASCVLALGVFASIGHESIMRYPNFIHSWRLMLLLALVVVGAMGLFLVRRTYLALGALILFSFVSVYNIHPLYLGFGQAYHSSVITAIKSMPGSKKWGSANNLSIENIPQMAGRGSITGTYTYPQLDLWREEDPANNNYTEVYNRYAHAVFRSGGADHPVLQQADFFTVPLHACRSYAQRNLGYILSTVPLQEECLSLAKTIHYPAANYYIYRVTAP